MVPEETLVTIVTPSFNMAGYLRETVQSVLSQDYPRIEYIVMDGGSQDETIALLERHGTRISYTSAPDKGPSDALFQGFRRARGEVLAWLNADDTLLPGAVRKAVEYLDAHQDVDVVYGEGWWIDERGGVLGRYPSLPFDKRTLQSDCFICQPTAFMRASAYRRFELDPDVNWSFDYDLWIRMSKGGARFALIPEYLANSRIHRGSKTIYERGKVFEFSMALLKRHYGYVPLPWIVGYTAFRRDGRDQFFEPLRASVLNYLASLPVGLWQNRGAPFRFLAEWFSKPVEVAWGRLRR